LKQSVSEEEKQPSRLEDENIEKEEHPSRGRKSVADKIQEKITPTTVSRPETDLLSPEGMKEILSARIRDADRRIKELEDLKKQKTELLFEKPTIRSFRLKSGTGGPNQKSISGLFSPADELMKLTKLHTDGALDDKEFAKIKKAVIDRFKT
jgi:hypothetical protein